MTREHENKAMAMAGIAHHCRKPSATLSALGTGGKMLSEWLMDSKQGRADLSEGRGVIVVGDSVNAVDALHLLARGVLMGLKRSCYITSIPRIAAELNDHYAIAVEHDCLFVEGVFTSYYETAPLSVEDRFRVEFFLSRILGQGKPLFFHSEQAWNSAEWWTPLFRKKIATRMREVPVL